MGMEFGVGNLASEMDSLRLSLSFGLILPIGIPDFCSF